jgi:transcriptional regulator with XRE-family HTH domain
MVFALSISAHAWPKYEPEQKRSICMDVNAVIDGILECKEETGMTFQQIADRSNVPKSTVTRVLRKETPNPSMKTLADIAIAVGYEIDPVRPAVLKDSTKDAYIMYLQEALEAEKKVCKAQIAEQKALRHQVVAEKNRTIFYLAISLIMTLVFLIGWLIMEILHPSAGWVRWEASANSVAFWRDFHKVAAEMVRHVAGVFVRFF